MKRLSTGTLRLMVMAASVAGLAATTAVPASAQNEQQPQVPQGWFKACSKQQNVDICNVQNIMMASTGQLLTGISIIELKGKVNRRIFQVSVPSGRMVPPGISMQIDGGKALKLEYVICFPDRCVAEAPLNDQLIAALKKGSKLTMTSVNFQNKQNPIDIALKGFTGAYDGPPLQQSDLADRRKKLQEYVQKNNSDFAKELKQEQDKAKKAK